MQQSRRKDRCNTGTISTAGSLNHVRLNLFMRPWDRFSRTLPSSRSKLAFAACLLVLVACSGTESDFESIESPDGKFTLIVTVTEPAVPHALHKVTAYIQAAGSSTRQMLLESPLANDGVPFTTRNIGVRWTGVTAALVCLRPTDLPDQGIRIDVSGTPSAEIKSGC